MIGLCVHGGWPLAIGLTVKEPEHCLCGERHGFKEVSIVRHSKQVPAPANTHSFVPGKQLCGSPRSTYALHTSPREWHSVAPVAQAMSLTVHQALAN